MNLSFRFELTAIVVITSFMLIGLDTLVAANSLHGGLNRNANDDP